MKILIFTEGTVLMHAAGKGKTREEIVTQSHDFGIQMENANLSFEDKANYGKGEVGGVHDYANYIPVGNALEKIKGWKNEGADIYYLTSRRIKDEIENIKNVLEKYGFPDANNLLFRQQGEGYKDVAERLMPNIFIEDDCESIGGAKEMTSTYFSPEAKQKIKTIVVKEFEGIDNVSI